MQHYNGNKSATLALADHHGPAYLRFGRPVVANFTPAKRVIGKAIMLSEGTDDRSYWTLSMGSASLLKHWKQRNFCR
jgi:transketolase C-terminal domain/subunit